MAIILRGDKGSALTHTELDNNFRQFFYSASYSGTSITLFTSASLNNSFEIPNTPPNGKEYFIQVKAGNDPSGSGALFTSSLNYRYDYRQSHLKNTGSFTNTGDGEFTGNLTVGGTITAQTFNTEYVSSSVIFESGSSQFGDSADDTHIFTGSIKLQGDYTGSDISIRDWGSVSSSLATLGSATVSYTDLTNVPSGIVSGSSIASSAQGEVALTTNGVAATAVDLGLQTTDSPTFAGLTVSGSINATGDITAYHSSDKRLKDNITPIPFAIDKVMQISGNTFDWNNLSENNGADVGVIAQEIESVLPQLVVDRDTGYKAVRYDKIVALLIEAVKEQQSEINELRRSIDRLKEQ